MARAKVVHSADAVTVIFKGNKKSPEPTSGVILFPGGHVEVSRTSDGDYWAHVYADDPSTVIDGRIDRTDRVQAASDLEDHEKVQHIAIRVHDGKFPEWKEV